MAKRRRRYIDGDVQDAIERLAIDTDWGGAQIERHLQKDDRVKDRLPILRTIQDIVKEYRPPDPSGTWSVTTADSETANLVLETLADVMMRTKGNVRTVTNGLAEWIVKVRTIFPDLSLFDAYHFAWLYNVRELNNEPTSDLDAYLAFKPWKSDAANEAHSRAVAEGWITSPPAILIFHDDGSIESRRWQEKGTANG